MKHYFKLRFMSSGIKGADEDELREMASTPHSKHIYNVPNFDMINQVQKELITQVCSGVEEQLNFLASGQEGTVHAHIIPLNSQRIDQLLEDL